MVPLARHLGNRAEKLSQGAAQAQTTGVLTALILALGVNPCTFAGNTRPARGRPGAETRQSTDQVEPVRRVRSRTVRGLAKPGRRGCGRARHRSSRFRHLRVRLHWHCPGVAIRVLPLGVLVHRSPSSQYPAPAGSDWASNAGPRRRPGPQTGPKALAAPPARLALTTDSARGPQRSRTE